METKYQRYYTPREPKDPDAEFLDAREVAYVFKTGVRTVLRRAKELGLGSTVGARKMFSREDRRAMYELRRSAIPTRIPTQRRRRQARKPAATSTRAAA